LPFFCAISFKIIYLDLKKSNSLALLAFERQLCDALGGAATAGGQSWIAGASIAFPASFDQLAYLHREAGDHANQALAVFSSTQR
jgi:hypothetical protein